MHLSHPARRGTPHRIAIVLASLLLPLFAARCGSGGGPAAPGAAIPLLWRRITTFCVSFWRTIYTTRAAS